MKLLIKNTGIYNGYYNFQLDDGSTIEVTIPQEITVPLFVTKELTLKEIKEKLKVAFGKVIFTKNKASKGYAMRVRSEEARKIVTYCTVHISGLKLKEEYTLLVDEGTIMKFKLIDTKEDKKSAAMEWGLYYIDRVFLLGDATRAKLAMLNYEISETELITLTKLGATVELK
jgi:hypothetical protein